MHSLSVYQRFGFGIFISFFASFMGYWWIQDPVDMTQDRYILWLAPPTSMVSWQRFVQALQNEVKGFAGNLGELDLSQAVPDNQGLVPEVVLKVGDKTLRWRWAMETGAMGDLLAGEIGESGRILAVIGGSTTESAMRLAKAMRIYSEGLAEDKRPLLLLQTATADTVQSGMVELDGGKVAQTEDLPSHEQLMKVYPGRTFRFGFNNRRIAEVVTRYVRDLYQPIAPSSPAMVVWEDDPYGVDVLDSFRSAFESQENWKGQIWGNPIRIRSGVAAMENPNRHELKAANDFASELGESRKLGRPWIVMGGQADPCRRFLGALARRLPTNNPKDLPLVAFGDTPGFNRVFRDQRLLWPLEDLPFELVFFSHQDPACFLAGFKPNPSVENKWQSNSTDDLLLWGNVAGAILATWGPLPEGPKIYSENLRKGFSLLKVKQDLSEGEGVGNYSLQFKAGGNIEEDGWPFFDAMGDRMPGTGEHLIHLEPTKTGATIRVISVGKGDNFSRKQRLLRMEAGRP